MIHMNARTLILLTTMLAAAVSCAPGADHMTANKQSYSVPFNPNVPPVFPASTINDEFRAQSPAIDSAGPRKFVSLDPKWTPFIPGVGSTLATQIDPIRQMAQISGLQEKRWGGILQALPVPAVGALVGYYLVTRMLNGWVDSSGNDDYGPQFFGILLGDQITTNQDASQLFFLGTQLARTTSDVDMRMMTSALLDYQGTIVPDGGTANPCQYLSAQVLSAQTAPGVYESEISFATSLDGIFFQELFKYEDLPIKIDGFTLAQQTNGVGMGTFADFIRYYPIEAGDDLSSDPPNGQILQLGSV